MLRFLDLVASFTGENSLGFVETVICRVSCDVVWLVEAEQVGFGRLKRLGKRDGRGKRRRFCCVAAAAAAAVWGV
jgi:hypothetical protein